MGYKSFYIIKLMVEYLKVQFLALRLMAKSNKRRSRSVSDKASYWMLTPYGEDVMMSLRAIRKPDSGLKTS